MLRKNQLLRKWISIALSLALIFSLFIPVAAKASEPSKDYMRIYAKELVKADQLIFDHEGLTTKNDDNTGKVIISGEKDKILFNTFKVNRTLNFDGNAVSRFSFDFLAKKGTKLQLAFYLDDQTEPFATEVIHKQKKKGDWKYSKEQTVDVSNLKLTGSHTLSFKVLSSSSKDVELAMNYFEFVEGSIPVIYFDIDESDGDTIGAMNADPAHETECYGTMKIKVPEGYRSVDTGKGLTGGSYEMEYIRGRGNSTWGNDKNPYKIKLDKKAAVLGMGKNKHWVLLANYYDNSLLRNRITYWLGHELGMPYTPHLEPVDVVMNGEYLGSYFLSEQVRLGENRVDLDNLEDSPSAASEPEITGGYLLSLYPYGDEENKKAFKTKKDVEFLIESPAFDGMLSNTEDYNKTQVEYIKGYVQDVEDALFGDDFKNSKGVSYKQFMDIESAVLYYWIQELSLNGDAYFSTSSYLYKPRSGKLYWGPLWDFDYVAWGSMEYEEPTTTGFSMLDSSFEWNSRMFEDRDVQILAAEKWEKALKPALRELIKSGGQLDKYYNDLKISARYNFEKYVPTGFEELEPGQRIPTYKEEIERLRTWISDRFSWVDSHISSIMPEETTLTFKDADDNVIATREAYVGKPLGALPEGPKLSGYVFTGWQHEYHYASLEEKIRSEFNLSYEEYVKELKETFTQEEIDEILISMEQDLDGVVDVFKDSAVSKDMVLKAVYIPKREVVPVRNIFFDQSTYYGEYYEDCENLIQIGYQVTPFDATFQELQWKSSDENIATVDEYGTVDVHSVGTVTITAIAPSGVSKSCLVKIYTDKEWEALDYPQRGPKTIEGTMKLAKGEYKQVPFIYEPEVGLSYGSYTQLIPVDPEIIEVGSAGVIHALRNGSTILICSDNETISFCKIVVGDGKIHKGDCVVRNGIEYKVLSTKNRQVTVKGLYSYKEKVKIPSAIKIGKKTYKVISIAAKAFAGNEDIKQISIGKNVKKIGKNAFKGCRNLKSVKLYSPKVKVYKNAFKGINKKALFKVPSKALKTYKAKFKTKKVIKF